MAAKRRAASFDPKAFLVKVGEGRTITHQADNKVIFSQGDPADAAFYVLKGKVKITVLSKRGKEAVLAILGTGDFFGEGCLNGQPRRTANATTMSECTIVRLKNSAMLRVLRSEPKFSELFIAYLLRRNARVEADLADHLFNSSERRLARLLLLLADFDQRGTTEAVIAPIRQETLAEMVGTTRSRVSSFMNKFRRQGFIDYNGTLRIRRSLAKVVLRD
jgi:CRP/FNR family transcriptional regulator, cyclic AMP receptor protein